MTLATLPKGQYAYGLAVDGTGVYANLASAIVKWPLSGGASVTLASVPNGGAYGGFALGSGHLYWSQYEADPDGGPGQYILESTPAGGGTTADVSTDSSPIGAIGTDATRVYWASSTSTVSAACAAPPCATLLAAPLDGGVAQTIATGVHTPTGFAFDASTVYWGTSDGRILKASKSGGSVTTLADYESTSVVAIGLQGSTLTWMASGGDVFATPVGGGASKAIEVASASVQLAVDDGEAMFWFSQTYTNESYQTALARTPLDGGPTESIWSLSAEGVQALASDAKSLYVATSNGELLKLPKP